ncbi:MAG: DNA mismatch repair protein MutS [Oscillospiraceae bacterium]|nr:DNA mismatch repair protein MutS [Oscillospiraceae bacterium]
MAEGTPLMRQYWEIKKQYEDCVLFYRLGDFYEMFNDDARLASRELDLVLTTRDRNLEDPEARTPMCGVPFHSSEAYIARLIAKGYKVAICEQLEDPALAKGLVERDVIRVVTPGTVIDPAMLDDGKPNYLASCCLDAGGAAVCFADISTGEICARAFAAGQEDRVLNEIARYAPSEIVLNSGAAENKNLELLLTKKLRCLIEREDSRFDYMQATMRSCEQFGAHSIDELGLAGEPQAVCAVGALLSYITDTQKTKLGHINKLDFYTDGRYMELDMETLRNLELLVSIRDGVKKGSLLWAMDRTKTSMGSRLLRGWVARPLLSPAAINRRLEAVGELCENNNARQELMLTLRDISDLERLLGRIVYGSSNARDLLSVRSSAERLPEIKRLLSFAKSPLLREAAAMDDLAELSSRIGQVICDEPNISVREGNLIRPGYDAEVDRLRDLLNGSSAALAAIEERERARTGKKLKVGYNKVFGYYIEIPRSQSADVPEDYIRKQTLVNCERFITEELKDLEAQLLGARDSVNDLEFRIYDELRQFIASEAQRIQAASRLIAAVDALCSLAQCAVSCGWCRPEITADDVIEIKDGRHPVVELWQKDSLFVPNDTFLGGGYGTTAVITGPNMAGKSTYMRQTALIVLMAQMGSFVPARSARIGLVDRVFTRIGASDDLSGGKSTFMVEMTEVANILRHATSRSLILLDEIGRGTSTYDGMSIAKAVVEFCANRRTLGARTLFATHYHELTSLADELEGVKNYNISAKKRGEELIFLRKIVPGGTDESYGIEVARLAGVPKSVIRRAGEILRDLSAQGPAAPAKAAARDEEEGQFSLESMASDEVRERIKAADINTMTPLEALNLLYELKKKVSG